MGKNGQLKGDKTIIYHNYCRNVSVFLQGATFRDHKSQAHKIFPWESGTLRMENGSSVIKRHASRRNNTQLLYCTTLPQRRKCNLYNIYVNINRYIKKVYGFREQFVTGLAHLSMLQLQFCCWCSAKRNVTVHTAAALFVSLPADKLCQKSAKMLIVDNISNNYFCQVFEEIHH